MPPGHRQHLKVSADEDDMPYAGERQHTPPRCSLRARLRDVRRIASPALARIFLHGKKSKMDDASTAFLDGARLMILCR